MTTADCRHIPHIHLACIKVYTLQLKNNHTCTNCPNIYTVHVIHCTCNTHEQCIPIMPTARKYLRFTRSAIWPLEEKGTYLSQDLPAINIQQRLHDLFFGLSATPSSMQCTSNVLQHIYSTFICIVQSQYYSHKCYMTRSATVHHNIFHSCVVKHNHRKNLTTQMRCILCVCLIYNTVQQ